jgi:hypothetical protein
VDGRHCCGNAGSEEQSLDLQRKIGLRRSQVLGLGLCGLSWAKSEDPKMGMLDGGADGFN